MPVDLEATISELQRAHGAFGRSQDRDGAERRLRQAVDQARRLLDHQPEPFPDGNLRHLYRQLLCYKILAEESLGAAGPRPAD
jgi:hypothetical protein